MIKQIAISFVTVFLILSSPVRAAPGFGVLNVTFIVPAPDAPDVGETDTQLGALPIVQLLPDIQVRGRTSPPALLPEMRKGVKPIEVGAPAWLTVTTAISSVWSF